MDCEFGDFTKKQRLFSSSSATFEEESGEAMEEDEEEAAANELLVSRLLETDAGSEINMEKVTFIEYPYSCPLIFGSSNTSTSFITINGNEDSCGSSFADLNASAMASIDVRTVNYISDGLFSEVYLRLRSDIHELVVVGSDLGENVEEEELEFFDMPVLSETEEMMLARFLWEDDVDD